MSVKPGSVSVLNTAKGDMKFSFDPSNQLEVERASKVVQDMLSRGYSLFVDEGDGTLKKVKKFDPKTNEYIIACGPTATVEPKEKESDLPTRGKPGPKPGSRGSSGRRVPARSVSTTGVAPTAGG